METKNDIEQRIKDLETALREMKGGLSAPENPGSPGGRMLERSPQFFYASGGLNGCREILEQMDSQGYVPLGIADIMKARAEAVDSKDESLKSSWLSRHLISADAFAYGKDSVKFLPNFLYLNRAHMGRPVFRGMIKLSNEDYNRLHGAEFSRDILAGLCSFSSIRGVRNNLNEGKNLARPEAEANPILRAVSADPDVLRSYLDMAYKEVLEKHGKDRALPVSMKSFWEGRAFLVPASLTSLEHCLGVSSYLAGCGITMPGVRRR